VVGVLVTDILPPSTRRLAALAKASVGALRRAYAGIPDVCVSAGDFTLLKGHLGAGYGAPTEEAVEAQRLMADLEGIQLETTYSAKCLAGLLRAAGDGEYRTSNLLFWNTFSSIDPAGGCKRVPDFHELPQPFHRFFDRATAG
jgi:1-aminocyclopropane-1-carboxylate deaminase/D-cysteine desulfhydrase-like pyridoxal-dependent ACC family enzyme